MVIGYEVQEDGTLTEVEISKDYLDSTIVFCVVDDDSKSIYLWKGSQAGVRRKFIGARVATNLRTEYGFNFKVRPIDEGEEPPTFFTALDGTSVATRVLKPGETAPPPTPPKPKTADAAETTAAPPPAPKPMTEPVSTPTPSTEPKTVSAPPPKPPTSKPTSSPAPRPAAPIAAAPVGEVADMIKEMEGIVPPEGYQRELVIVYNDLYTVAEHKTSVFGQEKIERRIEKVKDPPEGTFMAEGFIPRVIVKDGKVLGIELLKGTPDAILSPIKAEMKERLSDLITFFKSETEEESAGAMKAKPKDKKGKKLVAK
jgi:hypothetical protein